MLFLLLSVAFFGSIGAPVLWLTGTRPLRISVLTVFVLAAHVGMLAFIVAYSATFDLHHELESLRSVVGVLLGMPIAGILCGWLAARWYSARSRES
jgi:hypothetical protein